MDNASDSLPRCELKTEDSESDPDQRLELDYIVQAGEWSAFERVDALLARISQALCNHVRLPERRCTAVVALSDDAAVRQLNLQFRDKDRPTNVLSFPAPSPAAHNDGLLFLGDVVLASETLVREAGTGAISAADHFAHLVVHGLLHLIGFDHGCDEDAEIMERIEIAILADLDICDPYTDLQLEEAADQPG